MIIHFQIHSMFSLLNIEENVLKVINQDPFEVPNLSTLPELSIFPPSALTVDLLWISC